MSIMKLQQKGLIGRGFLVDFWVPKGLNKKLDHFSYWHCALVKMAKPDFPIFFSHTRTIFGQFMTIYCHFYGAYMPVFGDLIIGPKPSLKIRTASAIFWIYLGIFRDYHFNNVFFGNILFFVFHDRKLKLSTSV